MKKTQGKAEFSATTPAREKPPSIQTKARKPGAQNSGLIPISSSLNISTQTINRNTTVAAMSDSIANLLLGGLIMIRIVAAK